MRAPQVTADRAAGCFYGCATGDALGAPLEFKPRDAVPTVTEMLPARQFGLEAGSWTDDTSMMLCLAEALTAVRRGAEGEVRRAALERYARWHRSGYLSVNGVCFDVGRQVRFALWVFEDTGATVASNGDDDRSCGNGSLMRLAAVPIALRDAPPEAAYAAGADSSLATHAHPMCVHACGVFAALCHLALHGVGKAGLLEALRGWLDARLAAAGDAVAPLRARVTSGAFTALARDAVSSSGYVLDTLEAALWAFFGSDSFEAGAVLVVNLADDADTVGAVYGTLAGAHYGRAAIPDRWLRALRGRATLDRVFDDLMGATA